MGKKRVDGTLGAHTKTAFGAASPKEAITKAPLGGPGIGVGAQGADLRDQGISLGRVLAPICGNSRGFRRLLQILRRGLSLSLSLELG
jgi:hypothetical protein